MKITHEDIDRAYDEAMAWEPQQMAPQLNPQSVLEKLLPPKTTQQG